MKITTKFISSSALLVTFVALLSGSSYWLSERASTSLDASYAKSQYAAQTIDTLESTLQNELASLSRLSVLPEKEKELQLYREQYLVFVQTLDEFLQTIPRDDFILRSQAKTIREQHQYLKEVASRAVRTDLSEKEIQGIARSLDVFEQSLNIYIQALLKESNKQAESYLAQAESFHNQVVWLESLGFGTVVLLLVLQFLYLLKPVSDSLRHLQAGVDRMGHSSQSNPDDLKIQLNTGDELQTLATAFNQMGDRLAESYQELERRVDERTASLHQTNESLQKEVRDRTKAEARLKYALKRLKQTQLQLLQTEKMSSLGQLVAGVAHEINNPVSFIQGNLEPAQEYVDSLIGLVRSYQAEYPDASEELQYALAQADVDFIQSDFPQLLHSMKTGAERITTIVRSLRTFSHLDESETKVVNIHEGLDSALLLLSSQLSATAQRPQIETVRDYGNLPEIYCYPSQLNQVFMGLLTNAIDALTSSANHDVSVSVPTLTLTTEARADSVRISICDNGPGMSETVRKRIFNPFFTTKPVGSGMGLGLAMSYQIVVANHKGSITCTSSLGEGACFTIEIPLDLKLEGGSAIAYPQKSLQCLDRPTFTSDLR